ncbi:MAG: hypothetical protein KKA10_13825 [Euryarchaeota archaeon]|nr:hypothetical protein [Euryarchaeota archaeon]MCG2737393.1 hypothetical protein [Candidatus Methanoperedenaceae archaeon]
MQICQRPRMAHIACSRQSRCRSHNDHRDAELGNDAVTVDVVQRVGALNIAFAQATNHDLMTKLNDNAKNDSYMVIAKKYMNTTR